MGEASKSCTIEVDRQRLIRKTKGIDTHIELSSSEEQRIGDISLADIILNVLLACSLPLSNFGDAVEDEDASALAFGGLSKQ